MALVCRGCSRELLEEDFADDPRKKIVCPQCGASAFIAKPDASADPVKPFELTDKDRRLLKALRIKTDSERS